MTLRVKVVPRSAESEIVGTMAGGTLKVRIAAVPEKGKANDALISLLAKHFRVGRGDVEILSGRGAASKLIRIPDR
jgi:uncharacterized protein (TIGR00251 family)